MPVVASYLREGRLNLTKLCHLRGVLEPDTCLAVLEQAATMSEADVEELALKLDPKKATPGPRESIRPVAVLQIELPSVPTPPVPPPAPRVDPTPPPPPRPPHPSSSVISSR